MSVEVEQANISYCSAQNILPNISEFGFIFLFLFLQHSIEALIYFIFFFQLSPTFLCVFELQSNERKSICVCVHMCQCVFVGPKQSTSTEAPFQADAWLQAAITQCDGTAQYQPSWPHPRHHLQTIHPLINWWERQSEQAALQVNIKSLGMKAWRKRKEIKCLIESWNRQRKKKEKKMRAWKRISFSQYMIIQIRI